MEEHVQRRRAISNAECLCARWLDQPTPQLGASRVSADRPDVVFAEHRRTRSAWHAEPPRAAHGVSRSIRMKDQFLVDSYETERLKVLSAWAEFRDDDLLVRPRHDDARGRSVREHMVHQCVSEDAWFRTMLDVDVGAPPLPTPETRLEFISRYADDSGKRLDVLRRTLDEWGRRPRRSSTSGDHARG